jgi:hypothetical protein
VFLYLVYLLELEIKSLDIISINMILVSGNGIGRNSKTCVVKFSLNMMVKFNVP